MEKAVIGTSKRQNGRQTIVPWEDLLDGLSIPANENGGIGLIARVVKPPRGGRQDPMVEEIFAIKDLGHVLIQIPRGVVPVEREHPVVGTYWVFSLGDRNSGLPVHLHNSLIGEESQVLSGHAYVIARRWYLIDKAAYEKDGSNVPKKSTNYKLHIDVRPWSGEGGPTLRLREPQDTAREFYYRDADQAILFGEPDKDGFMTFATRSISWDAQQRTGINQWFQVVPYDPTDPSVGADPVIKPGTVHADDGGRATLAEAFTGVDLSKLDLSPPG